MTEDKNSLLYDLDLSKNSLDSNFVLNIKDLLLKSKSLKNFNLKDNLIEKIGVKFLIEVLENNSSLLTLDLRSNPGMDKKASIVILEKLKRNLKKSKSMKTKEEEPKKKQSDKRIEIKPVDILNTSPEKTMPNNTSDLFNKKVIKENSIIINKYGSIKKSINSNPTEIKKCDNCLLLKKQNLKLQFENKKLRIQLKSLNQKHPKLFKSCLLISLYDKP